MKRVLFAVLTVLLLNIKCYSKQPVDDLYQRFRTDQLELSIPYQAEEAAEDISEGELSLDNILTLTPMQIKNITVKKAVQAFSQYKFQLLSISTAVLLSAVLSSLSDIGKDSEIFDLICILTITTLLLDPVLECIQYSCDTMRELSRFMLIYIPIYTSIMISSGALGSAAIYQSSVMAAAQVLSQLSGRLFIPMMHGYLLVSLSGNIGGNKGIASFASAIKRMFNWVLVLSATAFTGVLSIQSFISGAADSAAAKTVKFLTGSFVPIIGSAFSDALSAMHGSMRIIKGSVGGFGIVIALLTFMPILIRITVLRAAIWSAKTAGEIVSAQRCTAILSVFNDLLSAMTALLLIIMMVFIITTAIMINSVTSL